MDARQLRQYDEELIGITRVRKKAFLEEYQATRKIDFELLFGRVPIASIYHWLPDFIPSRIVMLFNRPAFFNLAPYKDETAFAKGYNFSPEELENLVDRGYVVPFVENFEEFAGLDYLDSLLEKTRKLRIHLESFRVLNELELPYWKQHWGQEEIDRIVKNASVFGKYHFPDFSFEGQKFHRDRLAREYTRFALQGYPNLADAFLSLFRRGLISTVTLGKILGTGRYLCNELCGRPVVSFGQLGEFAKWNKAVSPLLDRSRMEKKEPPCPKDIFSFEFSHTLLSLGGHGKDAPLLFNPSIGWDDYLDLLQRIEKELIAINNDKMHLLRGERFKESIDDFLNTEHELTIRFQSIIEGSDKSYNKSKQWTAFGIYSTASILTWNPAPFLSGLAYELTKNTPFFDSLRKFGEYMIPKVIGKGITDKLDDKLTPLYDRLCRYPWAVLYFRLAQRDLPKHMKLTMRNYWVLRGKKTRTT